MNIKEAKEEIKNAMTVYFSKDEFGVYEIPVEKQRPVFLMGPPGIGKTAVMEQIAQELGVGLLSYSMTHHTRQSALGLPFIVKKEYGGKTYEISEYTMSEIIAAVYDKIEQSGVSEGILFLDEINCVSETLAPAMLQFLQYKTFGRHRVPHGWIVVAAGNPPEYNHSVREFDIVTWDRLKRIDVEPDYNVWKEYALNRRVHPAIITYLDIKKDDFYVVENYLGEKKFVTARGWDDLSTMIKLYEKKNIPITERLVSQYLQKESVAKSFAVYYDLFKKYQEDYQIEDILNGTVSENIIDHASNAKFDERLSLIGLILSAVNHRIGDFTVYESMMKQLVDSLRQMKRCCEDTDKDGVCRILHETRSSKLNRLEKQSEAGMISPADQKAGRLLCVVFESMEQTVGRSSCENGTQAYEIIKKIYAEKLSALKRDSSEIKDNLEHVFLFLERAFNSGDEILIFVTELTVNTDSAAFIGRYGCDAYFAHNKELLFYERQKELIAQIGELSFEEGL